MRRALGLAVLLAVVSSSRGLVPVGAAPAPIAAQTAAEVESPRAEDAWPVFDECVEGSRRAWNPDEPPAADDLLRWQRCGEAARAIVRSGTDVDRERLWS